MNRYLNKLFASSALALLLPACVSAASFSPTSDIDFNLTGDTSFSYDSYTISTGINISYTAPENSIIDIFSEGDIFIDGALSLMGDATYSFTSNTGSIYLNGDFNFSNNISLILNANSNLFLNSGNGSDAGGVTLSGNGGGLTSSGNTGGLTGSSIIIGNNGGLTAGPIILTGGSTDPGTITINPVIFTPTPTITGVILTLQLTPVPVPPSLLLFLTGLGTLAFGFKRSSN